jgi:hypothetical protein
MQRSPERDFSERSPNVDRREAGRAARTVTRQVLADGTRRDAQAEFKQQFVCDSFLTPGGGSRAPSYESAAGVRRVSEADQLGTSTAKTVGSPGGAGREAVLGFTTLKALRQSKQRLSNTMVRRVALSARRGRPSRS